jgi:MFS family permease
MAIANPTAYRAPWYARTATTAGRPIVLAIALLMCAPGEYHLARLAGWADPWAYGMPAALSAYAGIAAVVAASRPKGARGRASAIIGAGVAIVLALAAQIGAHLIDKGHMEGNQAWLVGLISAVPPAVVGHLLHLAATPVQATTGPLPPRGRRRDLQPAKTPAPADTPPVPATAAAIPPMPVAPPALPVAYEDPRCAVIRPLYDRGYRPATSTMLAALTAAGYLRTDGQPLTGGTIRGTIRGEVERLEPWLATLPAEGSLRIA